MGLVFPCTIETYVGIKRDKVSAIATVLKTPLITHDSPNIRIRQRCTITQTWWNDG